MSKPSAGALRAAERLISMYGPHDEGNSLSIRIAMAIDHETGLRELVEAGKWTLNIISGVNRSGGPVDPADDEPEAAFDSLKAAIARAEGREGA